VEGEREEEQKMNPYFQNWNYGYTLGPPSEQTKGAYTTYDQGSSGQVKQEPQQSWGQQHQGQADRSMPPPQHQKFVSAGVQPVKQEQIGPNKPQAVVNPSQYGDTPAAAASLFKLHELAVQNRLVEKYETVKEEQMGSSSGSPSFKVNLILGTETYQGEGPTVKMAKQIAAVQALKETKYQTATEQKYSLAGGGRKPIGVTATSELHEMAVKKGVRVEFKFLEPFNFEFKHQMRMWSKDEMRGNYKVQLNVAGYEFFGQADLPQTAKHNAASQAMAVIRALPDPGGVAKVVNPPLPGAPKVEPVSVPISLEGKNVNMALNEIAMCNGCVPEWTMIGEHGPPHQKTFTWQLTLGEFSTTGTGPNKKLARNVAAEQMMAQLPEEWKSKRSKSKKSGAGNKRPGFGSRLQNYPHHHHVPDDVPVFSVPPPRIILPSPQGPLNVEGKSQTDVKVTILKSPDVGGCGQGGDEETQTITLMKRPSAAPCNISRSEVESIRAGGGGPVKCLQQREEEFKEVQLITILKRPVVAPCNFSAPERKSSRAGGQVKSLKQREEEYEKARQRILGSHDGNSISSACDEVSVDDDEVTIER